MPKRANLALVACEACRRRKVRCDCVRPVCGACSHKDIACTFQSMPGVTRTASLKSELSQLRATNNMLLELFQQLRNGSPSDAWNLVEKIRSETSPDDHPTRPDAGVEIARPQPFISTRMFDALDTATDQQERGSPSPRHQFLATNHSSDPRQNGGAWRSLPQQQQQQQYQQRQPSAEFAVKSAIPGSPIALISPYQLSTEFKVGSLAIEDNDAFLQDSLQAHLGTIQQGFKVQQSRMSEIFFCHNNKTFDDLIACLKNEQAEPQTSAVLCELCAVAVVAGRYMQDAIEPGVLDHWYSFSQRHFSDCMAVSPASAIKVAAMLGLYNLLRKSRLAISYFETGLSLSTRYLEEHANEDNFAVSLDTLSTVRAQRSLNICNGWLQATLGYGYETSRVRPLHGGICLDLLMTNQGANISYTSEHDLVHSVAANIAVLKATTMRILWACSDVPGLLLSLRNLREQLGDWYERLPYEAQLTQLGGDDWTPLKSSILYVHLLHLGAIMLMFRHCLAGLQFPRDRESLSAEQRSTMNAVLNDGLQAAQHSARMTFLIQHVSQSVRHCWTMMCVSPMQNLQKPVACANADQTHRYQSYVSGMILIYNAVQLRLAGFSEKRCASTFDLASKVVDGLEFCKELDPVACKLTATLSDHYRCLRGADSHYENADDYGDWEPPNSGDYLFNVATQDEALHETSCGLFEELCNPYADGDTLIRLRENIPDMSNRMTATPRFPWKSRCWQGYAGSRYGEAPNAITPEISNLEDGYFAGIGEPSWWMVKRTSAAVSLGSATLEVSG